MAEKVADSVVEATEAISNVIGAVGDAVGKVFGMAPRHTKDSGPAAAKGRKTPQKKSPEELKVEAKAKRAESKRRMDALSAPKQPVTAVHADAFSPFRLSPLYATQ